MAGTNILKDPAPIDPHDERYALLLKNLQGNILKGHGRERAVLIFFRFARPAEEVRPKLAELVRQVTSAKDQLREAQQFRDFLLPGSLFVNFFLTASGYQGLGFSDAQLKAVFPWQDASSFHRGMKNVQELRDPPVEAWETNYRGSIDAMLLLADDDEYFLFRSARQVVDDIEQFATIVAVERGAALRDENGEGVEHFGYADGRSQPIFFKGDLDREGPTYAWHPEAPLSMVLFRDAAVPEEEAYGSFLVYRKLEQNVRGFVMREHDLADQLGLKGEDRKRAGAMVIGRFRDGTPLVLSGADGLQPQEENDFTYADDPDGAKCPFHAHIRKANPRGGLARFDPIEQNQVRIVRRAIPYGTKRAFPAVQNVADLPTEGVGLLFMCFQSIIELQFNFIQQSWANTADGTGLDPLIGQGPAAPQQWPNRWGRKEPRQESTFAGFVKMKGGEYFFAPSIAFLRKLAP